MADSSSSIDHLNTFLESREVSQIRYTLRTPWSETSDRTKRQHVRKARQAVSRVLSEMAPEDPGQLWHALSKSQATQQLFSADIEGGTGSTDETLLEALASCIRMQTNGKQSQFCENSRMDTRFNQISVCDG